MSKVDNIEFAQLSAPFFIKERTYADVVVEEVKNPKNWEFHENVYFFKTSNITLICTGQKNPFDFKNFVKDVILTHFFCDGGDVIFIDVSHNFDIHFKILLT